MDINEMGFLHSINLKDSIVCNNFSLPSPLFSVVALNHYAFNRPMITKAYNCDPNDLYLKPSKCISGAGSPCYRVIVMASIIRNGQEIINGFGEKVQLSESEKEDLIFKANLEIEFEKVRQKKFVSKPSRLSSIFVVEDSEDGRYCLRHIFISGIIRGKYDPHVLNVKILRCMAIHRGDVQWLDEYGRNPDEKAIEEYWLGNNFNVTPIVEYFLEGIIVPKYKSQIEELRIKGKFFQNSSNHFQDLDNPKFDQWFDD